MALGVDLFGKRADGSIEWHWMCHTWNGFTVLDMVDLPPSDPPPSWEGQISREQLRLLRDRFGGRDIEQELPGHAGEDLDALLQRPVHAIVLRVEEWGFG